MASLRQGVRRRQPPLRGRPTQGAQAGPAASVAEALRALRGTPAADPAGRAFAAIAVKALRAPGKAARELQDMHGSAGAKAAEQRAQAAATEALHVLGALKLVLGEIAEPAAEAKSPPRSLPSWTSPSPSSRSTRATRAHDTLLSHGRERRRRRRRSARRSRRRGRLRREGRLTDSESDPAAAATAAAAIAPSPRLRPPKPLVDRPWPCRWCARTRRRCDACTSSTPLNEGREGYSGGVSQLVKMLNSVHEGVAMEAAQCLNALVTRCVDANMVREGIKAMAAAKAAGRRHPRDLRRLSAWPTRSRLRSASGTAQHGPWRFPSSRLRSTD